MKKTLSLILAITMIFCVFNMTANAQAKYNAKFTLNASVGGKTYGTGDTITIKPGDTVSVTLKLKNDFYLGGVAAQVFYNSKIFTGATGTFNKDGQVYKASGSSMCIFTGWDDIASTYKQNWWPDYSATKKADFKANHRFCYMIMTPSPMRGTPIKNIDELLITYSFKVSSSVANGTTGQIVMPAESVCRKDYYDGRTYCEVYPTSDMSQGPVHNIDGLSYDMSKAVLNFKVSTSAKLGDVNNDGAINSADALLVLQNAVGSKTLTSAQKTAADVTKDGTINSADALKILQYAVGQIKSF